MAEFSQKDRLSGERAADSGFIQSVRNVDAAGNPTGPSGTAVITGVNSGVASGTLLTANTARRGAIITNTDANALLVNLAGGTASASSYSVRLAQNATYEVPYGYTGLITGIWEADGAGAALVTEFT